MEDMILATKKGRKTYVAGKYISVIAAIIMCTIVPTCVGTIMIWSREIEMIVIGIRDVNTEVPTVSTGIDGAVEILCLHKASILPAAKHQRRSSFRTSR